MIYNTRTRVFIGDARDCATNVRWRWFVEDEQEQRRRFPGAPGPLPRATPPAALPKRKIRAVKQQGIPEPSGEGGFTSSPQVSPLRDRLRGRTFAVASLMATFRACSCSWSLEKTGKNRRDVIQRRPPIILSHFCVTSPFGSAWTSNTLSAVFRDAAGTPTQKENLLGKRCFGRGGGSGLRLLRDAHPISSRNFNQRFQSK